MLTGLFIYFTVYLYLKKKFNKIYVKMRDLTAFEKWQIVGASIAGASVTKIHELIVFLRAIL